MAFWAIFLDRQIFGKKILHKFNSLFLGKLSLSGTSWNVFSPLFKNTTLMEDIITDILSLLYLLPYRVSRKNLPLTDYVRKTHLQCTKNEQCNLALVASDIDTYQSVLLFCKTRCNFSRSDWPHSQHRRTCLTSAVLTHGMQICSFISLFPCPSLLLHPEIHRRS